MEGILWLNIGLGIFWASLFMYILYERRKVVVLRMLLDDDYRGLVYRVNRLRRVWKSIGKMGNMYQQYDLSPDDRREISQMYILAIDILEEEEKHEKGTESLCESGRN